MIGLSTAPSAINPFQPPVQPTSTVSTFNAGTINDPNFSRFGENVTQQGQLRTLSYPLDSPKYIMTFSISKYNRTDLNSIGQFVDAGYPGIVLPLPQQLIDVNHVNWHEVEVGTLPGVFVNGMANMVRGVQGGNSSQALGGGILGALGVAGMVGAAAGGIGAALPGVGNIVRGGLQGAEAVFGFSPNQFLTLLMRGPTYKRHKFTWEFAPSNFEEANIINKIITTFKNAMAPNILVDFQGAPVIWSFPKIFRIRLYPNSKFLYKFKPCICDYCIVNDAPGGRASFRRNATGQTGDNPPAVIQFQLNFIELEFWIEGNYSSEGTTSEPNNNPDDYMNRLPR